MTRPLTDMRKDINENERAQTLSVSFMKILISHTSTSLSIIKQFYFTPYFS